MSNLSRYVDTTLHPERYHGHGRQPPFFEGWYYKLVTPDECERYAIIPGIFLSDDPAEHHAFVQVFDGISGRATYHRYPASDFYAAPNHFEVRIGPNRFTRQSVILDIDDAQRAVKADLRFHDLAPFPVTLAAPGIMGWFGWLPFMECYHGVVSLDHRIDGLLSDDEKRVDFSGGRGYIEKDWGKSFPSAWVWMQTNHFDTPGFSLTASVAMIPFVRRTFPGFIVGVWHDRTLYRLATYTNAKTTHLDVQDDNVLWTIEGSGLQLEIMARRAKTSALPGPSRAAMEKRVPETLNAEVSLCLTRRGAPRPIVEGTGRCAGLEVAGEMDTLLGALNMRGLKGRR